MTPTSRWSTTALVLLLSIACGAQQQTPQTGGLMPLDRLREMVPALAGWERGTINTQVLSSPDPGHTATVTFTQGEGRMDLEISDTGGNSKALESLASMAGADINRQVANGYFKGTTVSGAPAVESWNTQDRMGELTLWVNRRYIVHIAGRGLADAAPMRALAERVDLTPFK